MTQQALFQPRRWISVGHGVEVRAGGFTLQGEPRPSEGAAMVPKALSAVFAQVPGRRTLPPPAEAQPLD
ncbi:MAG: hypothetical protein Q8N23_13670 [Archangium sp.]|nr:hypothetical protein [Archangium sp.]MDP3153721.1 hypothetical protein [Archangium sp.]MDP3569230.1 hypothetical protein [Archangium sp.]